MKRNLIFTTALVISLVSCQTKEPTFLEKIQLADLEGIRVATNQFEGKIIILNLWATWCKPCIAEMPDLVNMQKQLTDDFVLIAASDESLDKINAFIQQRPYDLQFHQIKTSIDMLGVYSLPTTFVIGRDGQLLETLVGARKWDSPDQIEQLTAYLK